MVAEEKLDGQCRLAQVSSVQGFLTKIQGLRCLRLVCRVELGRVLRLYLQEGQGGRQVPGGGSGDKSHVGIAGVTLHSHVHL